MHIEELSKSQLILLTILVNFVMSIATGIVTVSLLDHAPPYVTQTVNRVVEHTIETVAQTTPSTVAAAVVAPAPSNQDQVTSAIGADASRAVSIFDGQTGTSTPAVAVGTYLAQAQVVVTAAASSLPAQALIGFSDGSYVSASLSREGKGVAIYGFANHAKLPALSAPKMLDVSALELGQTALAVSASGSAATGIVSRVSKTTVYTTLPDIGIGSAAVDLKGNLIGIAGSTAAGQLIPASTISAVLSATSTVIASTTTGS